MIRVTLFCLLTVLLGVTGRFTHAQEATGEASNAPSTDMDWTTLQVGDVVRVDVYELFVANQASALRMQVAEDGRLRFGWFFDVQASEQGIRAVEDAIAADLREAGILRRASVMVRLEARPQHRLADTPLQPGDLVRVSIFDFYEAGRCSDLLLQVAADGTLRLTFLEPFDVTAMTSREIEDAIAQQLQDAELLRNPSVSVLRFPDGRRNPGVHAPTPDDLEHP